MTMTVSQTPVAFQIERRDLEPMARALQGYKEYLTALILMHEKAHDTESAAYLDLLRLANTIERVRQAINKVLDNPGQPC
jgi:hypothetical protein